MACQSPSRHRGCRIRGDTISSRPGGSDWRRYSRPGVERQGGYPAQRQAGDLSGHYPAIAPIMSAEPEIRHVGLDGYGPSF